MIKPILVGVLSLSSLSYGSIPRQQSLEDILKTKSGEKFEELRARGPKVYGELKSLAFNVDRSMGLRWRAFMTLVQMGQKESLPEVREALSSSEWFMRDAALRVLPALDSKVAYKAAVDKLHDSSLIVRSAAVDVLKKVGDSHCADNLWNELYSKENYMHKQSLWIRRHIVEALSELAPKGHEEKFVKVLDDHDSSLFAPALKGLERIADDGVAKNLVSLSEKKSYWKSWIINHTSQAQR